MLEFTATEISVDEDLPAGWWLSGNELASATRQGRQRTFRVGKGVSAGDAGRAKVPGPWPALGRLPASLPPPAPAAVSPPLAVMGIGSWPRPPWMRAAIRDHLEGKLSDEAFDAPAEDATRLAVAAPLGAAGVVMTDSDPHRGCANLAWPGPGVAGVLLDLGQPPLVACPRPR